MCVCNGAVTPGLSREYDITFFFKKGRPKSVQQYSGGAQGTERHRNVILGDTHMLFPRRLATGVFRALRARSVPGVSPRVSPKMGGVRGVSDGVSLECQKGVPDTPGTLFRHSGAHRAPGTPRRTLPRTPPIFGDTLGTLRGHFGPEGPDRLLQQAGIADINIIFRAGFPTGEPPANQEATKDPKGSRAPLFRSTKVPQNTHFAVLWCNQRGVGDVLSVPL